MRDAARLDRAYVNNGGDIALHLTGAEQFAVGLMDRPDHRGVMQTISIEAAIPRHRDQRTWPQLFARDRRRGATVLAKTASQADAAATIIANAVDLPGHSAVIRCPANELQPDSDLGTRLVTRDVGALSESEIDDALSAGLAGLAIACSGID
jgi:ApbE superfamily uncharacterized protein (UPF0280 family)